MSLCLAEGLAAIRMDGRRHGEYGVHWDLGWKRNMDEAADTPVSNHE